MEGGVSQELAELSRNIHKDLLLLSKQLENPGVEAEYWIVELLVTLFHRILRSDPSDPQWAERDRFLMCNRHGRAVLCALLAENEYFPVEELIYCYQSETSIAGDELRRRAPGIELSASSPSNALSIAVGMALAAKRDGSAYRVFTLFKDSDCLNNFPWDVVEFAAQQQLDNLIVIIDAIKKQRLGIDGGWFSEQQDIGKWQRLGWTIQEIDGGSLTDIQIAFTGLPHQVGSPSCIIAAAAS